MQRTKADSFNAYLEEKQRAKSSAPRAPGGSPATTGKTPLSLLFALAQVPGQRMSLTDLMPVAGLAFADFAAAVKTLSESGYITVTGPPSSEIATLTKQGEDVARLAQSK